MILLVVGQERLFDAYVTPLNLDLFQAFDPSVAGVRRPRPRASTADGWRHFANQTASHTAACSRCTGRRIKAFFASTCGVAPHPSRLPTPPARR